MASPALLPHLPAQACPVQAGHALPVRTRVLARAAPREDDGHLTGPKKDAGLSSPAPADHPPLPRRSALVAGLVAAVASSAALAPAPPAAAIQGLTAGRIPGLSPTPSPDGTFLYSRPEGKSGGHGVGWSVIPKYRFSVPAGWEETPVSIADLGGTEIDLRYSAKSQGGLVVVVAPVARFVDVERNADVRITALGPPDVIIEAFAVELFGAPLNPGDVLETEVSSDKGTGLTYYRWALKPHRLVAATAVGNRLFFLAISASGVQWRRAEADLRAISASFRVDPFKL